MSQFVILFVILAVSIIFLKGFDRIAGRGPKQVKDGIKQSSLNKDRRKRKPCPYCSEMILVSA
jgi:hypothetical protein